MSKVARHYDLLIENGNDPVLDDETLSCYMDKWDGQTFIDLLALNKSKSVLEIGCGTGRIAKKLSTHPIVYTGVDISPKTIEMAKKHFVDCPNFTFICTDFSSYCFKQKYDIVFSTLTFMHIKNKSKAIKKVFSLLNLNGKFVLSIDKERKDFIDTGFCKIKVFPDNPNLIYAIMKKIGFCNISIIETDLAYIITGSK